MLYWLTLFVSSVIISNVSANSLNSNNMKRRVYVDREDTFVRKQRRRQMEESYLREMYGTLRDDKLKKELKEILLRYNRLKQSGVVDQARLTIMEYEFPKLIARQRVIDDGPKCKRKIESIVTSFAKEYWYRGTNIYTADTAEFASKNALVPNEYSYYKNWFYLKQDDASDLWKLCKEIIREKVLQNHKEFKDFRVVLGIERTSRKKYMMQSPEYKFSYQFYVDLKNWHSYKYWQFPIFGDEKVLQLLTIKGDKF